MEEKEFKAWLDTKRRSIDLRLDTNGAWWHDGAPFEHQRLINAFNRGISLHPDSGEPIIRIGATWCYFKSEQSPYIARRLLIADKKLIGVRLNTEAEVLLKNATFSTLDGQLVLNERQFGVIRFDRPSKLRSPLTLIEQNTGVAIQTGQGLIRVD